MKTVYILGLLSLLAHAKEYRFDYEWSEQAGGWLKYHAVPASWDEARRRCYAEGAVLASPLTWQIREAVLTLVKKQKNTPPRIYTGVHATFSRGDYSSVEGVPLLRLALVWAPGEPDNFNNSESCLSMTTDSQGLISDTQCSGILPYVCYKKDTQLSITDCGTSDLGYHLEPRTGSCYKFHKRGLVWTEAYMTCAAEGGYLTVINSAEEAQIVDAIFNKYSAKELSVPYKNSLSIGFHDWGRLGTSFMTIHGEALEDNYHNWADGEPDNVTNTRSGDSGQYCGSMFRGARLDDFYCGVPAVFICEKDPKSLLKN